jgi:hypothetical protein
LDFSPACFVEDVFLIPEGVISYTQAKKIVIGNPKSTKTTTNVCVQLGRRRAGNMIFITCSNTNEKPA